MSAMTVLEARDGDPADYLEIAERLPEVGIRTREDAHRLFRRAAVNVGLNNTADHIRNHGFLRHGGGWTLSLAFDINPDPNQSLRQTTVGGAATLEEESEGLIELARSCRIGVREARVALRDVVNAISGWRDVAASKGVPGSQLDLFSGSFAAGLETLRSA